MVKKLELTPGEVKYLKSKRIGLVLSGGASRGFAEAGVMSVFEKHSIQPVAVVGCSVGSLVGVCACAGKSVSLLQSEFIEHKPFSWRDISLTRRGGLISPEKVVNKVLKILEVESFKDLTIPLTVSATNLDTGKEKSFTRGKLLPALSSSIAFPGVLAPVKIGKYHFVDGGVTTPIPVHLLPKNIDLVVVIDVTGKIRPIEDSSSTLSLLRNVYEIMLHHISNREIEKIMKSMDAILIHPPVDTFGLFTFTVANSRKMMRVGVTSANASLKRGIRRVKARAARRAKLETELLVKAK